MPTIRGFGNGKRGGVRVVQYILPVPRYGNAFLLEIGDGGFGFRTHFTQTKIGCPRIAEFTVQRAVCWKKVLMRNPLNVLMGL